MTLLERAREMLELTAKYPRMVAVTKEALIMRAQTIIELFAPENERATNLYLRHLKVQGSAVMGAADEYDDEWARAVIADALKSLEG